MPIDGVRSGGAGACDRATNWANTIRNCSTSPRWLVLNKADLLLPEEARERRGDRARLEWKAPWFLVSAIGREGTREVCLKMQQFFDEQKYRRRSGC